MLGWFMRRILSTVKLPSGVRKAPITKSSVGSIRNSRLKRKNGRIPSHAQDRFSRRTGEPARAGAATRATLATQARRAQQVQAPRKGRPRQNQAADFIWV